MVQHTDQQPYPVYNRMSSLSLIGVTLCNVEHTIYCKRMQHAQRWHVLATAGRLLQAMRVLVPKQEVQLPCLHRLQVAGCL